MLHGFLLHERTNTYQGNLLIVVSWLDRFCSIANKYINSCLIKNVSVYEMFYFCILWGELHPRDLRRVTFLYETQHEIITHTDMLIVMPVVLPAPMSDTH